MIHKSTVFNFQEIIDSLREKVAKQKEERGKEMEIQPLLDAITEETEFEDLDLYHEYLSGFDAEHDLDGLELCCDSVMEKYKDDLLVLLRLVAASFASSYNLDYDAETKKVHLTISVTSGDKSITQKLETLWLFQIMRLFEIYVEEQLNLEALRKQSEKDRESVETDRQLRLVVYQKKIRMLKNQIEGDEPELSLDELLGN